MIPVCFAATKGIEPVARASTLAAIFGGIILLAITILLIPRFNLLNVSTPLYQDKENFISIMKILVSNSTETVAFLVIFPQIKGKIQKISKKIKKIQQGTIDTPRHKSQIQGLKGNKIFHSCKKRLDKKSVCVYNIPCLENAQE
jgi:hypothetical protein